MLAAVCRGFGSPLVIEEVRVADPGPGEVRVRMLATAICHSDITYADGGWGGELPALFGHEGAGEVVALGAGVEVLGVGDRVVVTLIRSCGRCHGCVRGMPVTCDATFPLDAATPFHDMHGAPIAQMMRTGAFAEEVVVHHSQLVPLPADVAPDVACLLACGVITGVGAATNTAAVEPGSHVAVIGCGGVGLNAVQGARLCGARTVTAIDVATAKLDVARAFGATHGLLADDPSLAGSLRALTDGRGADYVFVTVGAQRAFDASYELLAAGGAMVMVGMPPSGVTSSIDPGTMAARSQRILGSKMGSARIGTDIPMLIELYRQGRLLLDELVSGRFPLQRINEAMDDVRRGTALRNVITFV